jgi:hypothetical protein
MANGYAGGIIPEQVMTFAADPVLAAFAIAVVDLILRIIGFIVLYPIIKCLLTLIIFRPIWSFGIKKALLRRQNERLEERFVPEGKKKFVPRKRLKKTFLGRFVGGFMGSLQGLLVAFIILLPLLILSGFLTVNTTTQTNQDSDGVPLAVGLPDMGGMQDMLDDYLAQIDEMNAQGLGAMVKQITISGKSLDRYIFDRLFTTQVKQGDQVTDINWINELEGILQIARTVYNGGYLNNGFQLSDINEEKIADVNVVFNYLKTSDLIAYMIPTAAALGYDQFKDQLPAGITEEMAQIGVEKIQAIDWNGEFENIQAIVNAVLTFGSVEQLQAYMADPNLLLDLTPEEGEKLADVIRAFGNLQLLELVSVGAEYATTLASVQQQLTWIAEEERQTYLQDRLSFIIDNDGFISEEFGRLALLIEAIYTDEFGDVNLRQLISTSDPQAFLEAQNEEWIDHLLEKIVELELLINTIPVGVDYALYTQVGDMVDQTLAGELETALNEIDWKAEILNIGDIYKTAVNIGAAQLLGQNPDYLAFVDDVVSNNMDKVRIIVAKIFEESALVNAALELAAPMLVERFVSDQNIAGIIREALISDPDSGVVDFNVGQEINTILDIIEKIYVFTNASELVNFSGMTTESKFELFSGFGTLTTVQFEGLKTSFENLQLLNRVGQSGLEYVRDTMGIAQLYVPEDVSLGADIGSILGLGYYVAKYVSEQKPLYPTYEEIDFAPLFADADFRSYLLPTTENNHSTLLLANLAFNAKYYANDPSMSQYLSVPQTLLDASPESEAWNNELTALLGAVFDLAASFESSTVLTLSYQGLMGFVAAPTDASLELITQFADPLKADDTFGSLDSSVILRSSLKNVIDTFGTSTEASLGGYSVKVPDIALDGSMLKEGIIVELINGLAILVDDLNNTWQYTTISQLTSGLSADAILPAFNNLSDNSLLSFGNITLIKGVISEALLSDEIKSFGIEQLNGAQTFIQAPADFLDLDALLLDAEGVKGDEIGKLLISVRSLQLNSTGDLSSFGPQMLNDMIGRNLNGGMDDLDRFFDSGILYTFLDKALQIDGLNDFVNETLSGAFGGGSITIDITPHPAMLGNAVDHEPIEVGRIPKDEFRNIVVSLSLLGDPSTIGIETFPNMIDPYALSDDFTTFLNSNYIYVIVGRLFENQGFGDFVGGFLGDAFGDGIDLDMTAPSDAKGTTGVEENIISKAELRQIMVSFKLIGLDNGTDIDVETILALSGQNEIAGVDDFDRFIASKYIADKLSIILTSDAILDLLSMDRFEPVDFVLPVSTYTIIDGRKRLTNTEFAAIFNGLNVLGITSLDGNNISIETITSKTSAEITEVLESNFLYTFIDLMLKSETSFTIPSTALETAGEYTGMVKKSEISDIFVALSIFNLVSGQTPDPSEITIAQIQDLLNQTNSAIVQSLLSDAIIQALGVENIPDDAYETLGLLSQQELDAIVAALAVIAGDPNTPVTEIANQIDTLTVGQVNDLDLTITGSATIKQMLSDAIIDAINASNIPEEALNPLSSGSKVVLLSTTQDAPLRRLSDAELAEIIGALNILANNEPTTLITDISMDVKVGQAVQLKTNNSYLIKQLVSDNIVSALSSVVVIPDSAYIDAEKTRLKNEEINHMIDAMVVLANNNLDTPVASISTDVTVGQTQGLKTNGSLIIRQLISDNVIDILGVGSIPADAYDPLEPTMLTSSEISNMIDAIYILANKDDDLPVASITTDVTVGQVQDLSENTSLIIRQLISDNMVDILGAGSIPADAYDDTYPTMLTTNEINEMIEALVILAKGDLNLPVASISTDVNVGQVQDLKDSTSLIIRQLISDNIVDVLGASAIPDDSYDPLQPTMLTTNEINEMIEALVILAKGDLDLPVASISIDVTVGQVQELKDSTSLIIRQLITDNIVDVLGATVSIHADAYDPLQPSMFTTLEIGEMIDALVVLAKGDLDLPVASISTDVTVGQTQGLKNNQSLIIRQLITDNIEDVLGATVVFPTDAYDTNYPTMLTTTEIGQMIDALYELSDEDPNLPVASISTNVTVGQTQSLKDNTSLIINQLISDKIVETLSLTNTIPDEAYVNPVTKVILIDSEIDNMIDALYVLADGDDDMLVANVPTDVTIGQLKTLSNSTSVIIQRLITDSIVDSVQLNYFPETAYVDDTPGNQLKSSEISNMIIALEVLAGSVVPGDKDHIKVSAVSVNPSVGMTQELNDNASVIINQLISESIVDALSGSTIPDDAYVDPVTKLTLTDEEMDEMIGALLILANNNPNVLIADISTDVTVGQTQDLKANQSLIIRQLISDAIVDSVGLTATIPDDAYINPVTKERLTDTEINHMIDALLILADGNEALLVSAISTDITIGQLDDLTESDSMIMKQLISDSIIDAVGLSKVPDDAYVNDTPGNLLKPAEVGEMVDALRILAYNPLDPLADVDLVKVSAISIDVTVGQTQDLKANQSLIIRQLISDAIVDSVGLTVTIPNDAYINPVTKERLTDTEINHMIDALLILANGDETLLVSAISTDITIGQLDDLTESDSKIMKQLISDSIIDAVGLSKVPDDAYIDNTPGNLLKSVEIGDMVDALRILAYNPLDPLADVDLVKVSDISINVTVGQTQDLKTNNSVIIKQIISDSIVDMLTAPKIRDTAYINSNPSLRLTNAEIGYMIDALLVLSGNDEDMLVTDITVNESTLSITTLKSFNENSIILNRLISNAIIDGLGANDIPVESYEDSVAKTDIIRPEIDALLEALDILGIGTSGAGGIGMAQLTFADLDLVVAIGTTDAVKYPLGFSPIVAHILSEPMIAAVTDVRSGHDYGVPTTAYRNTKDLLHAEIEGLVAALKLIGNVQPEDEDDTTIADITIDPDSFNGDLINSLVALDALIVYRMISKGINDSNIDTIPSHVTDINARNYDPGLPGSPVIYDIKIAEMSHIADSMNILGITSIANVASEITVAGLKALTPAEIEILVEANTDGPNTIIYYIVSQTVDPSLNVFDSLVILDPINYPGPADDYYVIDGSRIRLKRTSIALAVDAL